MGRKKENKKKGEGAKKTQARSERAQLKALKKETGEDDIDTILNDIKKQDKARTAINITVCTSGPSPRSNAVFIAHPNAGKQELILFGGEYYNGKQTHVYNDLFIYNVTKNEWRQISSPNTPPPRSSAQAVALDREDGQIIVFGGEFTSPSGSQFHHYKDVWMLSLADYRWQQLSGSSTKGGPSARSGHRMILYKHQIFCFGGFHDSGRDVRYFNDLHIFDLDTCAWLTPIAISAHSWPSPRSGFCFWNATDELTSSGTPPVAYVYGGYVVERTKSGKSEQPHVLWDLWQLHLEKHTWTQVKKKGVYPGPRSGIAATSTRGRGLLFGGCTDQAPSKKTATDNKDEEEEDDEQDFESTFFNDLYVYVSDKQSFFPVSVRGTTHTPATTKQQQSHKQKQSQPEESNQKQETTSSSVFDFDPLAEALPSTTATSTTSTTSATSQDTPTSTLPPPTPPCARRSAHLTCKGSWLYVYGGVEEHGTREVTMSDIYQLDTAKSGGDWKCLVEYDISQQVWEGSDDEEEDEDEKEDEEGQEDDEDEDEDEDEEDEDEDEASSDKKDSKESADTPVPRSNETLPQFFDRTKQHWMTLALGEPSSGASSPSEPTPSPSKPIPEKELRRRAFAAASQVYNNNK